MSAQRNKRKYKQEYYSNKRSKDGGGGQYSSGLEIGQKGFLITTDNKNRCLGETYRLLNEHAEKLELFEPVEEKAVSEEKPEEEDISESLERECSSASGGDRRQQRLFFNSRTAFRSCIVLRTTLDDPTSFLYSLLKNVRDSGLPKTRFVQRILPIQLTCRAKIEDFEKVIEKFLIETFPDKESAPSYAVFFNSRAKSELNKENVIFVIGELMRGVSPMSKVNLTQPDKAIIVETFVNVCCLAVVDEYMALRRYNVQQVANIKQD